MGEGQGGSVNMIYACGPEDNSAPTINLTGKNISINSSVHRNWTSINTAYNFTGAVSSARNYNNLPKDGSTLNLGGVNTENISINLDIVGKGTNSEGKTVGLSAIGLFAYTQHNSEQQTNEGGQINAQAKNIFITAHSEYGAAYGVLAQNSTTVSTAENTATVRLKGDNIVIKATAGEGGNSYGLVAYSEGRITVDGNLEVGAQDAIVARGMAKISINEDGKHFTKLNGDINFNYDKETSGTTADATVSINLSGAESYWNGNAVTSYGTGEPPENYTDIRGLTLKMSDGAQWTPSVVDYSHGAVSGEQAVPINNMELKGGIVNVQSKDVKVRVQNLTGTGGTIRLATDLTAEAGQQTGQFTVDKADGSSLDVKLMDAQMNQALTSDEINADQAKSLITAVNGAVKPTTTVQEGMYNEGFSVDTNGNTTSTGPNTVMQSSLELAAAAPLALNRILMNDVRKRLGDIRTSEGTSGAWARYDGGRLSGSNGLENDFHTIQVGIDTQPTADPVRYGVAFSYTMSDTDYARGSAEMDAYSLAGYGVWLGESGQFIDIVARMATAKTDMTVDGTKKGSMDNVALSLSGEFGWRFDLGNSLFVEPQLEATYTYVDADQLVLNDGSGYDYQAVDSLLARAGAAFGLQCPNHMGNVYARISAVHEFLGDASVTGANGAVYELDGKDTWIEYGVGANFNLTKSTYLWADVERTSGGVLDEDYRATFGIRHAW